MEIPRPPVSGLGMTSEGLLQWEEAVIRLGESPLLLHYENDLSFRMNPPIGGEMRNLQLADRNC
jgi:hypothetical protein